MKTEVCKADDMNAAGLQSIPYWFSRWDLIHFGIFLQILLFF